jgi:hypothetical protein
MSEYEGKHSPEHTHHTDHQTHSQVNHAGTATGSTLTSGPEDLPPIPKYVEPAQKIHARFKLGEDARVPLHQQKKDGSGGWEQVNGLRVKMYPVQGEPFGSATPGGELNMVLANPAAIKIFKEAEIGQEYDVIFTPVHKAE